MAVWDSGYHSAHVSRGAGDGLISCATQDKIVYWRHTTDGSTWSTPVIVAVLYVDDDDQCHTWYDGKYVWVTNGVKIWRSASYGYTLSFVSY